MHGRKLLVLFLSGLFVLSMSCSMASAADSRIRILNNSGMRLHVYAAGLTEVGQIKPGSGWNIQLPIKYTYKGNRMQTRQLMVVGGGVWKADSSGWTTYRDAKTCTIHEFQANKDVDWNITGRAMKCEGPRGFRQ